jgi:aspartyl-tRNA(Asn)/glutamyl-tRNA(Gln) amidotransferase subunit A
MLDKLSLRASLVESTAQQTGCWDALLMPTCPVLPPFLLAVADDEGYDRYNMLLMRNTRVANVLDRCAVTLPVDRRDGLPVGITLMGLRGQDDELLAIAAAVESVLTERIAGEGAP